MGKSAGILLEVVKKWRNVISAYGPFNSLSSLTIWRKLNINKKRLEAIEYFWMEKHRRILGTVYENEKENWRILTNKEINANVKKPTLMETIKLNRLLWFGHVQRMEENRISKRVLYMNLVTTRLRGRPRNRWQDEVREDWRIVGEEGWQENVHNREEWRKLQRMARYRHILHVQMEWIYELMHMKKFNAAIILRKFMAAQ